MSAESMAISELKYRCSVSFLDAKIAFVEAGGDPDKAAAILGSPQRFSEAKERYYGRARGIDGQVIGFPLLKGATCPRYGEKFAREK